jgi:hypothetical protein
MSDRTGDGKREDSKRVSMRKGGEVDGEQYYIVGLYGLSENGDSVAFTEESVRDFLDKAERVVDGELNYGAVDVGEE